MWYVMEEIEYKVVSYDVWNFVIKLGLCCYILCILMMLLMIVIFWVMVFYVYMWLIFVDCICKNKFFGLGKVFYYLWIYLVLLCKIILEFFDFFWLFFYLWDEDNCVVFECLFKLILEIEVYVVVNGEVLLLLIWCKFLMVGVVGF